jgi:hypothetical protein
MILRSTPITAALALASTMLSCQNTSTHYVPQHSTSDDHDTDVVAEQKFSIQTDDLELIRTSTNFCSFQIPTGLFQKIDDETFHSDELGAQIKLQFTETLMYDDPNAIWDIQDFKQKLTEGRDVQYEVLKNDWIVLSGHTPSGDIYYLKGIFYKPEGVYFEDYGSNVQPYCFTSTIELIYPEDVKNEFDVLVPIITRSFKFNKPI